MGVYMEERIKKIRNKFINGSFNSITDEDINFIIEKSNDGNLYAKDVLGLMHCHGIGVDRNTDLAYSLVNEAADGGIVDALADIGDFYKSGIGTKRDYEKAILYYKKGELLGSVDSLVSLGEMYLSGYGVEKDEKVALEYFNKAADLGYPKGLCGLGYYYHQKNDIESARKYYKDAISKGSSLAYYYLGYIDMILNDFDSMITNYNEAISNGIVNAMVTLGSLYQSGIRGSLGNSVSPDYRKALELFRMAQERVGCLVDGNIYSCMGDMYQYGIDCEIDYDTAISYYKKAADAGNIKGQKAVFNHMYNYGESFDYAGYFNFMNVAYSSDEYFKKIKSSIDSGVVPITVNSLEDIASVQDIEDVDLNNEVNKKLDVILSELNDKNDNDLYCIKRYHPIDDSDLLADFYTVSDLKDVVMEIKELLSKVDLNQSQQDVFMQIYILLGSSIVEDHSLKGHQLTSANLLTLTSKMGVCGGVAFTLKNILSLIGFDSEILLSPYDEDGIGHAYNQVKINNKWYYCDLTHDLSNIRSGEDLSDCLKSGDTFISCRHHETICDNYHDALEDYPDFNDLYEKNYYKLFGVKPEKKDPFSSSLDALISISHEVSLDSIIEESTIKR